jgi:hypothetical protein
MAYLPPNPYTLDLHQMNPVELVSLYDCLYKMGYAAYMQKGLALGDALHPIVAELEANAGADGMWDTFFAYSRLDAWQIRSLRTEWTEKKLAEIAS